MGHYHDHQMHCAQSIRVDVMVGLLAKIFGSILKNVNFIVIYVHKCKLINKSVG